MVFLEPEQTNDVLVFPKSMTTTHGSTEHFPDIPESPGADIIYIPFYKQPCEVVGKDKRPAGPHTLHTVGIRASLDLVIYLFLGQVQ